MTLVAGPGFISIQTQELNVAHVFCSDVAGLGPHAL